MSAPRAATAFGLWMALALIAGPSMADEPPDLGPPEIRLQSLMGDSDPARRAALSSAPRWQSFRARHGAWSAWWNERTATPHRATGPAIPLAGFAGDSASVDAAVRAFVAEHRDLFQDPVLETVAIRLVRGTWYARYRQLLGGMPVVHSDWEFRIGSRGGLFLFGADAVAEASAPRPRLAAAVAREAARQEIAALGTVTRIQGGERALLVPQPDRDGVRLVPVYDLRVRTVNPTGNWAVMVDARSGVIVQRHDLVSHAIEGRVRGAVHLLSPLETPQTRDFPALRVTLDADTMHTDSLGHYTFDAASGTLGAGLRGHWIDVHRGDGPHAALSVPAPSSGTYDLEWTDANSLASERDAYYHGNVAHQYIKGIDPGLLRLDRPVPCAVNVTSFACNAFWDGDSMGFGIPNATCQNAASTPSIFHHEYGHGVTVELYRQLSNQPVEYLIGVLNESMAELNFMLTLDDVLEGRDFYGPGTFERKSDVEARWPEDRSGLDYNTMLILTGSFWDLRLDLGKALTERLVHFGKYGLPEDADDGTAMMEYFLEVLVADDDDADLSNGTPHIGAILRAFNARGLGTRFHFDFQHVPLADRVGGGLIPVTARMSLGGPLGALDPTSPTLVYSVDGAPFVELPMAPTANPDEFTVLMPAMEGSVVRYYLRARDRFGGTATLPVGAPARRPYAFLNGSPAVVFADDMEIDRGWTVGAPDDSATSGRWVRVDPHGTTIFGDTIQTEHDHTAAGVACWVTGDSPIVSNVNRDDVDGNRTSLTSPRLDASQVGNPVIEYHRWYMNRVLRGPETEYWRVLLSKDDGASWVAVENTAHSENRWERFLVRILDHMSPTHQMRIRFVARDSLVNGTVEGAVDDVRLVGFIPTATLLSSFEAVPVGGAIEVRWSFASAIDPAAVRLERAGAAHGPWVASATDPESQAGRFVARDRAVEPGRAYFYRLVVADREGAEQVFGPIAATAPGTPIALAIESVAPNPAFGMASIRFGLPATGPVKLRLYDSAGREVARLVDGRLRAGTHAVGWNAAALAPGLYFLRLEAESGIRRARVVALR